jgi:hypothetical protein
MRVEKTKGAVTATTTRMSKPSFPQERVGFQSQKANRQTRKEIALPRDH